MHNDKLDDVAEPIAIPQAAASQEEVRNGPVPVEAQTSPTQYGVDAATTAAILDIQTTLANLAERLESDAAQLRRKDEIIASINTELQEARAGFVTAILRPMFEEIVRLLGDLDDKLALDAAGETLDSQQLLQMVQQRLLTALENSGLYRQPPSDLEANPRLDPRVQSVARTIEVADPSQHQRIARVAMTAFHHEGKALLKEKVDVFRYVKPAVPVAAKETP